MSSKRLDAISDYARHGYVLRVDCCGCKHVALLDPRPIIETCQKRGWSRQMSFVEARLRCKRCRSRDVRCGPAFGEPP